MGTSYFPNDNNFVDLFNFSVFSEPSLVQFLHRNLAYIICLFYLFLLIKIYINNLSKFYFAINILGLVLLIQVVIGIFTLTYGAQMMLSSMHQTFSIFLVSSSVYLLYLNSKSTKDHSDQLS